MYTLIINCKQYKEAFSKDLQDLFKAVKDLKPLAKKKDVQIILAPPTIELKNNAKNNCICAQHVDYNEYGAYTGNITINSLKEIEVGGSLLNHSEHRISEDLIKKTIEKANKENFHICLCVENSKEVSKYKNLKPKFIAVEPPELIGGDISISTAKPDLIKKSVEASGDVPLLIGAGVKNSQDVKIGIELGAKGVLVASGIVKAKNKKEAIEELLNGF